MARYRKTAAPAPNTTPKPESSSASELERPFGLRVPDAEVERRVTAVTQLLAAGVDRSAIVRQCDKEFGAAERTVDRYIALARERIEEESRVGRAEARALGIVRLNHLSRAAEAQGKIGVAVHAERVKAKLTGVEQSPELDEPADRFDDAIDSMMDGVKAILKSLPKERINELAAAFRKRGITTQAAFEFGIAARAQVPPTTR